MLLGQVGNLLVDVEHAISAVDDIAVLGSLVLSLTDVAIEGMHVMVSGECTWLVIGGLIIIKAIVAAMLTGHPAE
jgi:hypothetical protein